MHAHEIGQMAADRWGNDQDAGAIFIDQALADFIERLQKRLGKAAVQHQPFITALPQGPQHKLLEIRLQGYHGHRLTK